MTNTLDIGKVFPMRFRCSPWFRSYWFCLSFVTVLMISVFTALATGAPAIYLVGQITLGLSAYVSLFLLADRPLVNPIQAFVIIFYWWFGVDPTVIAFWDYFMGMPDIALDAQVSCSEAIWIVAFGLLIYSIFAKQTLDWFSNKGLCAKFLLPKGKNYRPVVLVVFVSLAGFSMLILILLQHIGIQGQEETSFFGGTKTEIWWVGAIVAVGSIAPFVKSSLMVELAGSWKKIPLSIWLLIAFVVMQTVLSALFGGMKSPIAILGAYYVCAYVSNYQRPPWLILSVGALLFLIFITPYVGYGRAVAITARAENSLMRRQVFGEVIKDPTEYFPTSIEDLDPSVFFRGIAPIAGELARRNSLFHGEWQGETVWWGFEVLVPRVFMPGKREMNIGNFFAQTVGADMGITSAQDTLTNISVGIPFEFIGNYGLAAGVLSFGLIGVVWTLFCSWLLSPSRLSNHPLTPFMAISTMGMEGAFGHYLASLRSLIIPIILTYLVYRFFRGKV